MSTKYPNLMEAYNKLKEFERIHPELHKQINGIKTGGKRRRNKKSSRKRSKSRRRKSRFIK